MRDNGHKFSLGTFRLDIRKTFFTRRVMQPPKKAIVTTLPQTVVDYLSLEFSKTEPDKATAVPSDTSVLF